MSELSREAILAASLWKNYIQFEPDGTMARAEAIAEYIEQDLVKWDNRGADYK